MNRSGDERLSRPHSDDADADVDFAFGFVRGATYARASVSRVGRPSPSLDADAARSRRREEKNDRNVVLFSSGTDARDELIDPAPRVSFDRGTRRTSYGDVLDR